VFEYKNMNAVDHFKRLFAYDAWANQEVLAGLRAAAQAPARSAEFIAHLLAAERLWLHRIEQQQPAIRVWPEFTLQQCETMAADLSQPPKAIWLNWWTIKTAKVKTGRAA
jgi:uncharacterized damage-inducible protein DinB